MSKHKKFKGLDPDLKRKIGDIRLYQTASVSKAITEIEQAHLREKTAHLRNERLQAIGSERNLTDDE